MRDHIPKELRNTIRDRYIAGVADAVAGYELNCADEDALTGALGQSISTPSARVFQSGDDVYVWSIKSIKIRGRGPGAPERCLGADGIFQAEIRHNNRVIFLKGLPFQSKKGRAGSVKKLRSQSEDMIREAGDGVVIEFSERGYEGYKAIDVMRSMDNIESKERQRPQSMSLGHMLGDSFMDCEVGVVGLYYDARDERFMKWPIRDVFHVVDTQIHKFSPET